jgi:hypothetical protein
MINLAASAVTAPRAWKKSEIAAVKKLLPVGGTYAWEAGKFHNLEASDFIKDPNGGDAHGFVTGKEIAWAISRTVIF